MDMDVQHPQSGSEADQDAPKDAPIEEPLHGELGLSHLTATGPHGVVVAPLLSGTIATAPDQQTVVDPSSVHPFYTLGDPTLTDEEDENDGFGSILSAPFQLSGAIAPVSTVSDHQRAQIQAGSVPPTGTTSGKTGGRRLVPNARVLFIGVLVVVLLFAGTLAVFAQSMPSAPLQTMLPSPVGARAGTNTKPSKPSPSSAKQATKGPDATKGKAAARPPEPPKAVTSTPAAHGSTPTSQMGAGSGTWLPQLPAAWTTAGLTTGDALFAERTAVAFTDREMSLDYRSVGTRANHGGTLTAAVFVLTPGGKTRFAHNDVRVINNVLFDRVQHEQRVQAVINAQPQWETFEIIGSQHFVWVTVSFQLWQSKRDGTGTRQEGVDRDPTTQQPRVHRMMVLLANTPQNAQGGAMGGTGWLVSTYALDQPGAVELLQSA